MRLYLIKIALRRVNLPIRLTFFRILWQLYMDLQPKGR